MIVSLSLSLSLVFVFSSCTQDNETVNSSTASPDFKQIEDYYFIGDIHNEYMEDLALNFVGPKDLTKDEALAYLKGFLIDFEPQDDRFLTQFRAEFSKDDYGWNIFDHNELKSNSSSSAFMTSIDDAYQSGLIDSWEKQLVTDLITLSQNTPTFEDLKVFFDDKILEWQNRGYLEGNTDGDFSGSLLALGFKSTEWWIANPQYQYAPTQRIAPWVAADAVGFALGCTFHIGSYAVNNNGSLEGCCGNGMAVSAFGGAIAGSAGVVTKAGKWLSGWL
ncbi:MAG: hypothetical protein AB8G11_21500 [Saprospiraceae bacterium]